MKDFIKNGIEKLLKALRRQWRMVWLVVLFAGAMGFLMWGLPSLVVFTISQPFDKIDSDQQRIDLLQLLPRGTVPPTPSPTPEPTATPKGPFKYPDDITPSQKLAVDAAINGYSGLLGIKIDLPGYECTISSVVLPPRIAQETISADATATASESATKAKTPPASPTPSKATAKPTRTPKGKTAAHSASPTPSTTPDNPPEPTASTNPREPYWLIEWKPVDFYSRVGDLLGGQFMTFSAQVRQKDLAILSLDTIVYGKQTKLKALDNSQRVSISYNLITKMRFTPVMAYVIDTEFNDEDGKSVMINTTIRVKIKVNPDKEETNWVKVVIDEFSGKVIGFSMDDSWY
jgi:hypothetical protein